MLLCCWRVLVDQLWRTKTIACGNWLKFGSFSCSNLKNNWQDHFQSENSRGGNCLLLPHAGYAYAGETKQAAHGTSGSINANLLNSHYARISTDPHYVKPAKKLTCGIEGGPGIHEFQIFKLLYKLSTT